MTSDREKKRLRVEVVYALRDEQALVTLEVDEGTTVREVIERSGLLGRYPEIELNRGCVGVFGKPVQLNAQLGDGDRVEIYRSLIADPKDARRERARRARRR